MKPIQRLDLFTGPIVTVTGVGPVTPTEGLDVSGVNGDWTVFCEVVSQSPAKRFQITLEGSADGFSTRTVHLIAGGAGSIGPTADKVYSVRKYELPDSWIIGSVDGKLRCDVTKLDSGSSLTMRAWVQWASAL